MHYVYDIIWYLHVCTVSWYSLFFLLSLLSGIHVHYGNIIKVRFNLLLFISLTAQDMVWSPRNKRPEKLKDGLKEVEVIHIYLK